MTNAPAIAVVGAGPAGLMAADVLAAGGAAVTVYDRMPSAGRKFLMAGRGGLNLTHGEPLDRFMTRYGAAAPRLAAAIDALPPGALRTWSEALGEPTFVGSSGRVFPKSFKASPLLRAWLRRLDAAGVTFRFRHRWTGWDAHGRLRFDTPDGPVEADAAATVLALGGASWPRLGSDGGWTDVLGQTGVSVTPLRAANCGFVAGWSDIFGERFAGQPLKRIALSFAGRTVRGEAVVTRDGLEGGAVYALSGALREAVLASGEAVLQVALRPDLADAELARRLAAPRGKQSLANVLRKAAGLSPVAIGLLHESAIRSGEPLSRLAPEALARRINAVPVRLIGLAAIDRAISTAGGVAFDGLDAGFMLLARPGTFVAGEMLDFDAPTGGYLLQAAFSTGAAAGRAALVWGAEKA